MYKIINLSLLHCSPSDLQQFLLSLPHCTQLVHNRFNALNNIWLNLREGKQTLTMLLKQSNKGHLGQSVKIVCCICKTVYNSESISSSKPVNTSEFSLTFVRVDWHTHAVDKLRKLQSLYDIARKNLKKD